MMEFSTTTEVLIFCGIIILLAMLLMELLDWSCIIAAFECPLHGCPPKAFLYSHNTGPTIWQCTFPEARGSKQSPINIVSRDATVLIRAEALYWRGYSDEPLSMSLANDGNTVVLSGYWPSPSRPTLQGGPLSRRYFEFHSALFRWGPADDEGSEHSIDYTRYPLELQVLHKKRFDTSKKAAGKCRYNLAIVSYFFQTTSVDNPYLDHVVTNLWRVCNPGACVHIPAFPLEWLFPSFERNYYSYCGSLTQPPCSEIVTWLVQPDPISISVAQMAQFRKICSTEGPILSNTRPVQMLNDRELFYYS